MENGKGATMNLRWVGAIMVVAGSAGVGFIMAYHYKREMSLLRQLSQILSFMHCELTYRLTPLPELCSKASEQANGELKLFIHDLNERLQQQTTADAEECMSLALQDHPQIPERTRRHLEILGNSLGRFDLEGQLKGIESVRMNCVRELEELEHNRTQRIRGYQTLGLCAGAALAILFL